MYYSFYMNEKLALDEWAYYNDCNWLLAHLLCKDNRKTIAEKLDFYMDNYHEIDENQWWFDDDDLDADTFREDYEEYQQRKVMYVDYQPNHIFDMWEEDMCERRKNKEAAFIKKTTRNRRMGVKLREIDKVILYKSDFAIINKAKKEYGLTEKQIQILFGLIFFSRMNNARWCRIGTDFKWKSFNACFDKSISPFDMIKILDTGLVTRVKVEKGKAFNQLGIEQADYLHIEAEDDFIYENFDNQDEVAYEFVTTLQNNRLNLTKLAKEVIPNFKSKYCTVCGKVFEPNSNRQKMCEECKEQTQKEQARLRKQKQRDREKGLLPQFEKKKKLTAKERELEQIQADYHEQKSEDIKLYEEAMEKPLL